MATTDAARAAIFTEGHLAAVSEWMTPTVATRLEFHELVPYKTLLKRFFSSAPWSEEDRQRLSELVAPKLDDGWSDTLVLGGLTVSHGVAGGTYRIEVTSADAPTEPSHWDRVFDGPVVPEPTPHPRKVKFSLGGEPAPGVWHRRSDEIDDGRVARLFEEADVTDVMVAGDFVTIGLARHAAWEERLDPLLALVTELFPHGAQRDGVRTREELVSEGRALDVTRPDQLHLLDPDEPSARAALEEAAGADDPRLRRVAVVVLAESADDGLARAVLRRGYADRSRIVRRAAVDAAADREDEALRPLFEAALASPDAWVRWKAVRALGDLGAEPSEAAIAAREDDEDFQVRFEVERVLRGLV